MSEAIGTRGGTARSAVERRALLAGLMDRIESAWASYEAPRWHEPDVPARLRDAMHDGLPERCCPIDDALDDAVTLLEASVNPGRPLFAAYIGSTGLETGLAGAALALAYDVNLASHAGGAELIEQQALAWVAEFVGVPHRHGAFTSGGMTSNLSALLAAREHALPGSRQNGFDGRRAAVYCSAEAHASVIRAVESIGLGSRQLRWIPIDGERRLRAVDLAAVLARDRATGVVPIAVVATAGTTLTGAVDPIAWIADVCAENRVWLHVDGAYGLPAAAIDSHSGLFTGIERADSLTVDAHKWLGMQKSCSAVLFRDDQALDAAFGHRARYMLQPEGRKNPVDRTLEYSRPLRSLKLWLSFRAYGAATYRSWIEHTITLAARFAGAIESDDSMELLHRPMLTTVCFRHHPRSGNLDEHNRRLATELNRDGRTHIASASLDGRTCLRANFVNYRTRPEDVDTLAAVVRQIGDELSETY
jgi:aromatic-L-amino-acid/L-tryptophan decarboxylase